MRTLPARALLLLALGAGANAQEDALDLLRRRMQEAKDKVFPALVHILNVEESFVGGRKVRSVNAGSGFFIDDRGHIVTNYHVAGATTRLTVTLASKRQLRAELVAGDPYTDLAVLRVDPAEAFSGGPGAFATFGDSDRLQEGEFVMAMGSPLSLSRSISFGIVSCRERLLNTMRLGGYETGKYNTWIQTDAAINPGNSGGPLVDLQGRIVGVNTRANLAANNIGFAIPSSVAREVVAALLAHGTVPRSWIGLRLQPSEEVADTALGAASGGALVAAVARGSPGDRMGIRPGDFVTHLQGAPFGARFEEEVPELYRRIAALPADQPAKVTLVRGGATLELMVRPERLGEQVGREVELSELGITVRAITPGMSRELGLEDAQGVLVTGISPGSPAGGKLTPGDVIRAVERTEAVDLDAFLAALEKVRSARKPLLRLTYRQGAALDVTVLVPNYPEE